MRESCPWRDGILDSISIRDATVTHICCFLWCPSVWTKDSLLKRNSGSILQRATVEPRTYTALAGLGYSKKQPVGLDELHVPQANQP